MNVDELASLIRRSLQKSKAVEVDGLGQQIAMRQRARPPVPGFLDDVHGKRGAVREHRRLAVGVERRQSVPGVSGNCLPHWACRTSIALADGVSAKPGAWALKPECFAVISRQVSGAKR